MLENVDNPLPPFEEDALDDTQRVLWVRLPEEYRKFLRTYNGGWVPERRYTFRTGVPNETADAASRTDAPTEFLGFRTGPAQAGAPRDLAEVAREHAAGGFLPRDMIAIASCVQKSLVCLSLRPDSFGRVFYWDWYWKYPWCRKFFEDRRNAVHARYPDAHEVLENPQHPRFREVTDALNFASVVEIAPDFSAWIAGCEDQRQPGAG